MKKTTTTKTKTAGRVVTIVRDAAGRIVKATSEPAEPTRKIRYPFEKRGKFR